MLQTNDRIKVWRLHRALPGGARATDGISEWLAANTHTQAAPPAVLRVAAPTLRPLLLEEHRLSTAHAHECLLKSLGVLDDTDHCAQVVEHVEGMTLEQLGVATGPLPAMAVCHIGRQVAHALTELHEREPRLAHGALGGDRVLIDRGGNARLLDVGRARPANALRMRSPERSAEAAEPSVADDLFGLGILLADAATGTAFEAPRDEPDARALLAQLPARLQDAILILLAPKDARFHNATAVVRVFTDLERKLTDENNHPLHKDGAAALRHAVLEALRTPLRIHTSGGTPFSPGGTVPDLLLAPDGAAADVHAALPTRELSVDAVLSGHALRAVAALGEQAANSRPSQRKLLQDLMDAADPATERMDAPRFADAPQVDAPPLAAAPFGISLLRGLPASFVVAAGSALLLLGVVLGLLFVRH